MCLLLLVSELKNIENDILSVLMVMNKTLYNVFRGSSREAFSSKIKRQGNNND